MFVKPVLHSDALIGVDFCSGGGGVKSAMIDAGIKPLRGIEFDPVNPNYSRQLQWLQFENFSEYNSEMILSTVQEVANQGFPGFPRNFFILHASPPCVNYSRLKSLGSQKGRLKGEMKNDIELGDAIASGIVHLQPDHFTLECVPDYRHGEAYKSIYRALLRADYRVTAKTINCADYLTPQDRERLFVYASRNHLQPLLMPPKQPKIGWRSVITGLSVKETRFSDNQESALAKYLLENVPDDLLIQKTTYASKTPLIRASCEPSFTITKSLFLDARGGSRSRAMTAWIDGKSCALSLRAIANICGFPHWYKLPNSFAIAGAILGNSLPPSTYTYFLRSNLFRMGLLNKTV